MMRKLGLLLLFVMIVSAQAQDMRWCVSVWYPSSEYPGGEDTIIAQAGMIDEVNPFWYNPMPDGTLQPHGDAENAEQLAAWRDADLLIVPSIFTSVSIMIEDENTRADHIASIIETVERMDYDGIDIDYEGFPRHTREDFSLFIEALAEGLHANNRILSVTVHAKTTDESPYDGAHAQDWQRITAVADTFRIMTYDYTNRNEAPGPIAPTDWVMDVLTYAESVTDLEQVQMGLHFYGYSWQRGTPPATTVSWASISNWVESFELTFERNPDDMEAMVDFKVPGLRRQTVAIADPIGLDFKLATISEAFPELGGVSIWGVGGEHPDLWATLATYTSGCSTN